MKRARAASKYRSLAREAAKNAGVESGPWERALITATFYHSQKRRRDDVNHLAMLKPAYDGLVDSGLIVDDDSEHLKTQTPIFLIDRKFPRVELKIERSDDITAH